MKLTRWLSRASATTAILTVIATGLVSPASAAAPPPWAADLPDLSTPQIAYNRAAAPVVTGVAARGADGALLYSPRSGNGLGPLQSLGGLIIGDPSVVVTVNGTHFFVRGTDDQVYTNTITPSGAVTGYSVVPGLTVTGEIESISPLLEPAGSIRIFARGPDGAVWNNILRNGVWTGWSSLGGFATSEITAARTFVVPQSTIRVFVRGSDHRIYVNAVTPTGASGFQPLGDLRATSNIAVADDTIFPGNQVFVRGEDNAVWYYNLVSAPQMWRSIGGTATSDPAVSSAPNLTAVYVRGPDDAVYYNRQGVTQAYLGYLRIDGAVAGNPAAFYANPAGGPVTELLLARLAGGSLASNYQANSNAVSPGPFAGYIPIAGPLVS